MALTKIKSPGIDTNIDIAGTLDVTAAATFDNHITAAGTIKGSYASSSVGEKFQIMRVTASGNPDTVDGRQYTTYYTTMQVAAAEDLHMELHADTIFEIKWDNPNGYANDSLSTTDYGRLASFKPQEGVKLFYNDVKKLETTTGGVAVTGDATFTGDAIAGGDPNSAANIGAKIQNEGIVQACRAGTDTLFVGSLHNSGATSTINAAGAATFAGPINAGAELNSGSGVNIYGGGSIYIRQAGTGAADKLLILQNDNNAEVANLNGAGGATFGDQVTCTNASLPTFKLDYNSSQFDAYMQLRGNDLEIRGSSGQMEFYTGSADGASSTERMRLTDGGQLLLNTTNNASNAEPVLVVSGRANAATDSGILHIKRGEAAASMSAADAIGEITFTALDGGPAAQILAKAWTGWGGTSDCPGNLIFKTAADGGNAPLDRMNIDHEGIIHTTSGPASGVTDMRLVNGNMSLADDATYTSTNSPINTAAIVCVSTNKNESGSAVYPTALFFVSYYTSTIVKLADPDPTFDVADTDGKMCIYKSGNSPNFTVKNRLGQTNLVCINIIGLKGM